jgi:hypothetical protein
MKMPGPLILSFSREGRRDVVATGPDLLPLPLRERVGVRGLRLREDKDSCENLSA